MKNDLYQKLVDMYAGSELSEELNEELETAAMDDPQLSHEMFTLKRTVETLQATPKPEFTEESNQRILLKMQLQTGEEIKTKSPEPAYWQYHLPIQG